MKRLHVFALLSVLVAIGLGTAPLTPPARAQATGPQTAPETVSIAYFYERLAPFGEWVQHARLGWVWYPTKVAAGWRPYTHGRWILTEEYGWYWQSEEDWGWAVFHYGRWSYDAQYGWVWVPGTVWGPGWVAWRTGDAYVGWAPLPPGVDYTDAGDLAWGDIDLMDDPYANYWVFVTGRLFLGRSLYRYALPLSRNRALLRATRNATRFERRNGRVFNRGLAPADVARRFGRAVPQARVRQVTAPQALRQAAPANTVNVFRPRVTRNAALRPPTRANRTPPRTRGQRQALPPGPTTTTPRTTTPRTTTPRTTTPQTTAPRTTAPRTTTPRTTTPQTTPRTTTPRTTTPRTTTPRTTTPRTTTPRTTTPRTTTPRTTTPRTTTPRTTTPRTTTPRTTPPRAPTPAYAATDATAPGPQAQPARRET